MIAKDYTLGIDIGSTTVKIAILDPSYKIMFADYRRHHADIQGTLRALVQDAHAQLGNITVHPVITGSGGLTLATHLQVPFVQEVVSVSTALEKIAPKYCSIDVKLCEGGEGFLIPISSPAFQAASKAMTEVYGIEPVPSRGGGSIAVLADMKKILGTDPLLMGFGLERDTIHSPNERYLLKQFFAGMESIAKFYEYYD